jgi:hypothetical protein
MSGLIIDPTAPFDFPDLGSVCFPETGEEETGEILQFSRAREPGITPSNIIGLFVRDNQTGPQPVIPPLSTFEIKPRTEVAPDDHRGNWTLIAGENQRIVHGNILEDYAEAAERNFYVTNGNLVIEADMAFSSTDSTMAILKKIQFHVQRAVSMKAYLITFRIWPKMLGNIAPKLEEMARRDWITWDPLKLEGSLAATSGFDTTLKAAFIFVVYSDVKGGFRDTKRPLNELEQKALTELWNQES